MSTVYNLEPPTKGKVILKTTLGNIDIELWPKEAPLAVRNFVQLALEGYYDGSIFHRMIKDFLVQGGDPTGTGSGGESIYGGPFKDEFHSRLRFSHRGLVACANQNEKDTNGAQFFITLDAASWLDKTNTIFGRVQGDTVFNLLKFNDLEVDDDDRPVEPPSITEIEVVWNPFEDIKPRITAEQRRTIEEEKRKEQNKKPKREGKRKLALLSFGEEAEQEEQELLAAAVPAKIKSAHDVLEDERLEKAAPADQPFMPSAELLRIRDKLEKKTDKSERASKKAKQKGDEQDDDGDDCVREGEKEVTQADFATKMRSKMEARREAMGDARRRKDKGKEGGAARAAELREPPPPPPAKIEEDGDNRDCSDRRHERGESKGRERGGESSSGGGSGNESDGDDPVAEVRRRKAELEGSKAESSKRTLGRVVTEVQVENADLLKPYQVMREQYKQRKRVIGNREKDTLQKLSKFKELLKAKKVADAQQKVADPPQDQPAEYNNQEDKGYSGQVRTDIDHRKYMPAAWRVDDYLYNHDEEDGDEQGIEGLKGHVLKFSDAKKHDPMQRTETVDDYVVFDPLLEKGKGKFSKTQQKEKKRNTEWAKRSAA